LAAAASRAWLDVVVIRTRNWISGCHDDSCRLRCLLLPKNKNKKKKSQRELVGQQQQLNNFHQRCATYTRDGKGRFHMIWIYTPPLCSRWEGNGKSHPHGSTRHPVVAQCKHT
jgi:hypothetical protein